jgi:hypothetical protein
MIIKTILIILTLNLCGCSATANLEVMWQRVLTSMRKQGEIMVRTPEKTHDKYSCEPYQKIVFQLEEIEILPTVISAGSELNQRIRYAFCPYTPSGTLKGSIVRTVLFKGAQISHDNADYEFKPGTWRIDVFIGIPEDAENGSYAIDTILRYGSETIKKTHSFVVKGRK